MKISLGIIIMALKGMKVENHVLNTNAYSFSMCLPLSEDAEMASDCLFVGSLSSALKITNNNAVIICRRDRLQDSSETFEKTKNLIIVNENISEAELIIKIQRRFFDVINWQQELNNMAMSGSSAQELVDKSYPMLNGFIEITDSSFQKMAQTTLIECDEPVSIRLKKYGYHPDETVKSFRNHNLFNVWEKNNDVFYDPCTEVVKYPTLHKVFKFHGSYYAHCVMELNRETISDGMTELFRIFVSALSICIEKDWEGKISCVHPYDNLISDILSGRISKSTELETKSAYIGLPLEGEFYVAKVVPGEKQEVPFGSLLRSFGEYVCHTKYIYMNSSIAAIVSVNSEYLFETASASLRKFCQENACICGISSSFDKLIQAKGHLDQADISIRYNRLLLSNAEKYPNINETNTTSVIFFDNIYPYCAFGEGKDFSRVWYNLKYHDIIKEIYMHDATHQTNDIKLLRAYISAQGQVSSIAQELNMHRNSVVYRLQRLNEVYGIDLNNASCRMCINVSLRLAELYGFR